MQKLLVLLLRVLQALEVFMETSEAAFVPPNTLLHARYKRYCADIGNYLHKMPRNEFWLNQMVIEVPSSENSTSCTGHDYINRFNSIIE